MSDPNPTPAISKFEQSALQKIMANIETLAQNYQDNPGGSSRKLWSIDLVHLQTELNLARDIVNEGTR